MFVEIALAGGVFLLLKHFFQRDPPRQNGVYALPGKWYHMKRLVFIVMMHIRQWRNTKDIEGTLKDAQKHGAGYGRRSRRSPEDMDKAQVLSAETHAIDCTYMNGFDSNGTWVVMRVGRRHGNKSEVWMTLNVPGEGVFQSPQHPDTAVYNTDGKSFAAGGLNFECVEPMRRWRVTFNGLLRKGMCNEWSERENAELVHVKFSFMWESFTDVFDFDTDLSPKAIASTIAREQWTKEFWNRLRSTHQTHYEQWGELHGVCQIAGKPEMHLHLRGLRDHSYGVRDWRTIHRYVIHFGYLDDGTAFNLATVCMPGALSYLQCGYVSTPCGIMEPVSYTDFDMASHGENINPPDKYVIRFVAGGKNYKILVSEVTTPRYYLHDDWGSVVLERICNFECDGVKGRGIAECIYRYHDGSPVPAHIPVARLAEVPLDAFSENDQQELSLTFESPACTNSALVGGKGCQLAILTQASDESYEVPQGFCITIAAFELQIKENPSLLEGIEKLAQIASRQVPGDLPAECEKVVAAFMSTPLVEPIQDTLQHELGWIYRDAEEDGSDFRTFAVRSSAAGEDGEEMSGAGQMDTVLGVMGYLKLQKAVQKCWASHFAYVAVEYRRQHGQPIRSSMGVVIQQMVESEASGVLFTQEPLTSNPGLLVINANYGLGESVVSGTSDPDTITLSRTWNNEVKVIKVEVGGKKKQVKVIHGGGTEEIDVDSNAATKCCLSEDLILRLAQIGIKLETGFSGPRDIEWAVAENQIYLLQARPVTAQRLETEWELLHEFDTPMASDQEVLTTANIGEMMPGAVSPLTASIFINAIDYTFHMWFKKVHVYPKCYSFHKFVEITCNNTFMNLHAMYGLCESRALGGKKDMMDVSLMGNVLEDVPLEEVYKYWPKSSFCSRLQCAITNYSLWYKSYGKTKEWERKLENYSVGEHSTAISLYEAICRQKTDYYECWLDTVINTARSGAWSSVLLSVLSKGKAEWTTEMYSDVALLLSKCDNVYSADVPMAMKEISSFIVKSGQAEEFSKMTPTDAVTWIQTSGPENVRHKFSQFLTRHGHRCVREAEFLERSWQSEPQKVVSVLQAMSGGPQTSTGTVPEDVPLKEIISKMKTKVSAGEKWFLEKILLPRARRAVGDREWGKSISIKMVEAFKQAYWKLAAMMVKEGYLPEEKLLFYLSHTEIGHVLRNRSGGLIARAKRRMRIHPKQASLVFHKVNRGRPQPVEEENEENEDFVITSVCLKGMPVSQGVVRGTARVVTSLAEAVNIKNGEILIVPYTDVGWSPYFPLISGLVTEIGGLVSHGSVVAREYGLPCVVSVTKATKLFKSGDQVILNGTKGTLEKIE